jgi:hypothetical protein
MARESFLSHAVLYAFEPADRRGTFRLMLSWRPRHPMVSPGRARLNARVWPTWMEYSDITATGTLLAALFAPPLPQAEVASTPTTSTVA